MSSSPCISYSASSASHSKHRPSGHVRPGCARLCPNRDTAIERATFVAFRTDRSIALHFNTLARISPGDSLVGGESQ